MKNPNRSIKRRAITPFFGSIFHTIIYYFITPIFVFLAVVGLSINNRFWGAALLFALLTFLFYILSTLQRISPALRLSVDILADDFITEEFVYVDSVLNRHYFFLAKEGAFIWSSKKVERGDFLQIYCYRKSDKIRFSLLSSRYHGMIQGEKYTLTYGKRSKVLISILSDTGEEMWDIPYEQWVTHRANMFSRMEKQYRNKKR